MSTETLAVVGRVQEILGSDNIVADLNDEGDRAKFEAALAQVVEPDLEVTMVASPTAGGARVVRTGVAGFRDAWLDWSESFESYRIEVDDLIEAGDNVVSLVRQLGVTKTGGVEIEAKAAAVWTVRDGRLAAVEFHLDQDEAIKAAGLDPEDHAG